MGSWIPPAHASFYVPYTSHTLSALLIPNLPGSPGKGKRHPSPYNCCANTCSMVNSEYSRIINYPAENIYIKNILKGSYFKIFFLYITEIAGLPMKL